MRYKCVAAAAASAVFLRLFGLKNFAVLPGSTWLTMLRDLLDSAAAAAAAFGLTVGSCR